MPQINKLPASDTLQGGDLFAVYISNQGDARKVSATTLLKFIQDNLTSEEGFGSYSTQYSAPNATGFSVALTDGKDDNTNIHLILTPTNDFASGTLVLPTPTSLVDKQEVLVNCSRQVATLTVDINGAQAIFGAPTVLAADSFFRLKYDAAVQTWYRVG